MTEENKVLYGNCWGGEGGQLDAFLSVRFMSLFWSLLSEEEKKRTGTTHGIINNVSVTTHLNPRGCKTISVYVIKTLS